MMSLFQIAIQLFVRACFLASMCCGGENESWMGSSAHVEEIGREFKARM
jgi:hypothetical protein